MTSHGHPTASPHHRRAICCTAFTTRGTALNSTTLLFFVCVFFWFVPCLPCHTPGALMILLGCRTTAVFVRVASILVSSYHILRPTMESHPSKDSGFQAQRPFSRVSRNLSLRAVFHTPAHTPLRDFSLTTSMSSSQNVARVVRMMHSFHALSPTLDTHKRRVKRSSFNVI